MKILGNGNLSTKLTIVAHAVSAGAREKIESAGGTVSLLREPKDKKRRSKKARVSEVKPAPSSETGSEAEAPEG